ncbi:MAG: hypothetical protein WDM80_07005 [Limisphaerales bacterium]
MHVIRNGFTLGLGFLLMTQLALLGQADLEIQAQYGPVSPPFGNVTITVSNRGPAVLANATVGFVPATVTPAAVFGNPGPVPTGSSPPGGTATVTFLINLSSPGYAAVEVLTASPPDTDSVPGNQNPFEDDFAQIWLGASPPPSANLQVYQTVNPTNVAVGGQAVFTVQLANLSFLSVSNISVQVNWPPSLGLVTATATAGFYNISSGVWTVDSLSVSQTVVLTLVGTVTTAGSYTNTATLTACSPSDIITANNYSQVTVTGTNADAADLELMAKADVLSPVINSTVTIQVTVTNRGPSAASGIIVSNSLPPGLTFVSGSAVPSVGGYSEGSRLWSVGSLAANGSALLTFDALAATSGIWTNRLEVTTGNPADPDSPHGNGVVGEDDLAELVFTITPVLAFATTPSSGQLTLSWDVTAGNFQVLSTTSLTPPVNWQPYSVPVYTVGNLRKAYIPTTSPPPIRFFKLGTTPYVLPPPVVQVSQHDDFVTLDWEAVPGAVTYNVRVYDQPPVPGVTLPVYSLLNVPINNVNVTSLPSGQTFYFTVSSVNAAGEGNESVAVSGRTGPFSFIYGQVYAEVVRGNQTVMVNLQGISVFASNTVSGVVAPVTISGMDGVYDLADVGAGTWKIGWSGPGIVSDFTATNLVLTNDSILLPIKVALATNTSLDAVVARVRFADGTVPVLFEPFWDVNVRPQISLLNSSNMVVATGKVADDGSVVLLPPVQKTGVNYTLHTTVEAASVDVPFTGVPTTVVDVVIPNRPPSITDAFAAQNGRPLLRAAPGSAVQLGATTTDPDGDALAFEWRVNTSLTTPAPANSATPNWTVPADNGTYYAYVMARDGKGGYAFSRVDLIAGGDIGFSGTVKTDDPFNPVLLVGATVSVNAVTTNTTVGGFDVRVPLATNYLLQASYPGFVPVTLQFNDQASYLDIRLKQLSTNRINIVSGQATNVMTTSGIILEIPPDSVVRTNGNLYTGLVDIYTSVIDPCDPTTYFPTPRVIDDPDLGHGYMQSYAAGYAIMKLPFNGEPVEISPLTPGRIRMPVGPNCASNGVPPTLRHGRFTTNIVGSVTIATNYYNGTNYYFSYYTQGGLFNDYQFRPLAKVKIVVDRTINLPFVARVSHTLGQPEYRTVFDDATSGVFDVHEGESVLVDILGLKEAPGDYYHNVSPGQPATPDSQKTVIAGSYFVAAAGTNIVRMTLTNWAPEIDLNEISRPQHFLAQGYRNSFDTNLANLGRDAFITLANNYYKVINAPANFAQWKQLHGFYSSNNVLTAGAQYYNVIDLGFARSMAMTVRLGPDGQTNVAYYVTNYRTVEDAIAEKDSIATVAMDYAALTNGESRYTKFYAFGPGANGVLLPVANLDNVNNGDKPLPNLCIVCHGGKFVKNEGGKNNPPGGDLEATFLPFDLEAYTFSKARGIQHDEFAKLNLGVLYTKPTPAISNLVVGWYGGVPGGTRTNFNPNFVPPEWSANTTLYRDAFKTSCRGCHISRRPQGTYFNSLASFMKKVEASETVVENFTMPNSQRTFGIFWGSHTAHVLNTNTGPDQVQTYRTATGP